MRLEELYSKVTDSEELKAEFVAAVKENRLGEFLKEQGCETAEAEVAEFLKSKWSAEGEMADEELDAVAGGCNGEEPTPSSISYGLLCVADMVKSIMEGRSESEFGSGELLCLDYTV